MAREVNTLRELALMAADPEQGKVLLGRLAENFGISLAECQARLDKSIKETRYYTHVTEADYIHLMQERLGACVARAYRANINKVWGLCYEFLFRNQRLLTHRGSEFHLPFIYSLNRWLWEELHVYESPTDADTMLDRITLARSLCRGEERVAQNCQKSHQANIELLSEAGRRETYGGIRTELEDLAKEIRGLRQKTF